MVLETSVLVGVVLKENRYHSLLQRASTASVLLVGAATVLETGIVLSGCLKRDPWLLLTHSLCNLNAEIVDFSAIHYEAATAAFLRFGKRRHPAALNFGDSMSYALAKVSGLPCSILGQIFPDLTFRAHRAA